jgi:hypothetical protein
VVPPNSHLVQSRGRQMTGSGPAQASRLLLASEP